MSIDVKTNFEKASKQIDQINKYSETAIQRTTNDFVSRAPAWVSKAVASVYGVSTKDVKSAYKKGAGKASGKVKVKGVQIDNKVLFYQGRVLTPTHFKMRPSKAPKTKKRAKEVTAEIFKGRRKGLGSKVFLAGNGSGKAIPFVRKGDSAYPIKAIRTLSVPQMITNKKVKGLINDSINENLQKRLEHHVDTQLKRMNK